MSDTAFQIEAQHRKHDAWELLEEHDSYRAAYGSMMEKAHFEGVQYRQLRIVDGHGTVKVVVQPVPKPKSAS